MLALVPSNSDALQVVVAQLVNALTVVANLPHSRALLCGDVGDAHCGAGDSGNRIDNLIQRAFSVLGFFGGGPGMFHLCAHALNRLPGGQLQPANEGLDLAGGACGPLRKGADFFGNHGKAAAHFSSTGGLNGRIECQQVGLVGDGADHGQDPANGRRLFCQAFDALCIALYFPDQRAQPGQALVYYALPLGNGQAGAATGIGSMAGIPCDLGDGGLQFAQCVTDLGRINSLAFGAAVQAVAEFGQGLAAAGDLLGIQAQGAHQIHQVLAQAIERSLNVMQLAIGLAQLDVAAEVAVGPGRQRPGQMGQDLGQSALQSVDQQCDQQNQANHQTLDQPHLALDLPVLGAHLRFQRGNCLLHGVEFQVGAVAEQGPLFYLGLGALEFGGVAVQQVVQLSLEADPRIFGLCRAFGLQPHQRGEIVVAGSILRAYSQ